MADAAVEKFRPTSGRVMGVIGLALAATIVAVALIDRDQDIPAYVVWVVLFVGVVIWAAMLRPLVWVTASRLVFRSMLSTISMPLAAIEHVVVSQVLAVRVGDRRYVSASIGKPLREQMRRGREEAPTPAESYGAFVETRIHHLAEEARAQAGIKRYSDEQVALAGQVHRAWAWPEVAALAISAVGFVVSLVV